jgi:hypothetical protein
MKKLKWCPVLNHPNTWTKPSKNQGGESRLALCTVYVDDFVLTGYDLPQLWKELRESVVLSDPEPIDKMLGCIFKIKRTGTVSVCTQQMTEFLESAVEQYRTTPGALALHHADTPSIEIDESDINAAEGIMQKYSASLLMKVFYAARCCRPDLVFPIAYLSRFISKWTVHRDKQLHRLYCYVFSTAQMILVSTIDSKDEPLLELGGFPDADHSGCLHTGRSTSGNWLELASPSNSSCAALEWSSKRQGATAHSTTEAELISASKLLRESALPSQEFWSLLLNRPVLLNLREDNQATIKVIENGYSAALRHVSKVHRVNLSVISEVCQEPDVSVTYVETDKQKGDLLTKPLARLKLQEACNLAGLIIPKSRL